MYKKLIFISLITLLLLSNISKADSFDKDLIDKRIENLQGIDIPAFYDSTLALIAKLQSCSNTNFGLEKSNELFEFIKSRKGLYSNRLHWIHMEVFTDSAKLNYLNRAEILAKTYNSEINIAWVNYTKGVFYVQKQIYDKSIKYLLEAKDIYESLEDKKHLALISQLFGEIYFSSQLYKSALTYYQYAYDNIYGSLEFVNERQFILLNDIGHVYLRMENYDLAVKYFNTALKEKFNKLPENQKSKAISYLYASISEAYLEKGEIKKAKEFINKALDVSNEEDEYFLASNFSYLKSRIEYEEGDFNKALLSIQKSMKISKKSSRSFVLQTKLFNHISNIYQKLEKTELAYINLKKHDILKDSLDKVANTNTSLLLIAEKEYELINQENRRNRLKFIYSGWIIFFLLIALFIIYFLYAKVRKTNLKLIEKALSDNKKTKIIDNKVETNSTDNNLQKIIAELNELMKKEKPFLDVNFSLPKAATLLNTNTSYLSRAINTILNKNFNSYMNIFKIKNAIMLIENGEAERITIEALAEKSGCKNRSVFNTAFKNYTGVTPSFFINNYKSHL